MARIFKSFDELYDESCEEEEKNIDPEIFKVKIDELIEERFICYGEYNDEPIYLINEKLKKEEIDTIEDKTKKAIVLYLYKNPNTYFVLQNTQTGKMRIIIKNLLKCAKDSNFKIVSYIFLDNNKDQAAQTADAITKEFTRLNKKFKLFILSSNDKVDYETIKIEIDAYSTDILEDGEEPEYGMPIILALANDHQCKKVLSLMNHIHKKVINKKSLLRNHCQWDECDKTYPALRDNQFDIKGDIISCKTLMVDKTDALHELWFISATEGRLLETESQLLDYNYPECANAEIFSPEIPAEHREHYRALHHPEAITHTMEYTSRHTNNSYAMEVIEKNFEHFTTPITLLTGESYYPKTIINSNSKTKDQEDLAKWCVKKNMYALVFNGVRGTSIKLYRDGEEVMIFKTSKKRLNGLLYYIYKMCNLNDKAIVLLGRRKVDRGIGFHYCPMVNDEIRIEGELGPLVTSNKDGLVWNNEILGSIKNKASAVQKAGRLGGIIANSPQYPGNINYWTDKETEKMIRDHNTMVDFTNHSENEGLSISDAIDLAKERIARMKLTQVTQVFESDTRKKESNPIITFDITDEEFEQFNGLGINHIQRNEFMMNLLKIYKPEDYQTYSHYEPRTWKMNTQQKIEKWGMDKMLKDGAVSTTTNIEDHAKNCIMFYINEKKIIINAWSGERKD